MTRHWLGKKLSMETKKKLSISHLKNPTRFWLGKKRSPETIKKMSDSGRRRKVSQETREKISNTLRGVPRSEETKRKISESQKGAKAWNWQGGLTLKNNVRRTIEYKFWVRQCLIRDNFTCQKSKISGGKLEVHHINNFAEFPELRFDLDNGITLSEEEHKAFHKKYGRKGNTKEQLAEFLQENDSTMLK